MPVLLEISQIIQCLKPQHICCHSFGRLCIIDRIFASAPESEIQPIWAAAVASDLHDICILDLSLLPLITLVVDNCLVLTGEDEGRQGAPHKASVEDFNEGVLF